MAEGRKNKTVNGLRAACLTAWRRKNEKQGKLNNLVI